MGACKNAVGGNIKGASFAAALLASSQRMRATVMQQLQQQWQQHPGQSTGTC